MNKIAYLTWGETAQIISYYDFAKYIDALVYVSNVPSVDLSQYSVLIIPDQHDASYFTAAIKRQINDFIAQGGFLVAFSLDGKEQWIEALDVTFVQHPNKDWHWWMRANPYIEIKCVNPETSLNNAIPLKNMGWHWMGVYQTNDASAVSYVNTDDDSGSLLLDFPGLPNGGRVLISTLDPHYHNGARFIPATTAFLKGFYPWLNKEIQRTLDIPDFTVAYIQSGPAGKEREPDYLAPTLEGTPANLAFLPVENINPQALSKTDIVYIPRFVDRIILQKKQEFLMDFLHNGGHIIACTETAFSWLPMLKPFQAVKPQPLGNLRTRIRHDPFEFFANMPDGFDVWGGVTGYYARGWSEVPEGGLWLTDIGSTDDPKPADWIWQSALDIESIHPHMPGKLFVHNGDNLIRYPDFGEHKGCLFRDICLGLMKYRNVPINPFTRFEHVIKR